MTRLKNQFLGVVKNPFNLVVMISLIVLFCLIVIPLLQMIASTFTVAKGELRRIPGAKVGDFTLSTAAAFAHHRSAAQISAAPETIISIASR